MRVVKNTCMYRRLEMVSKAMKLGQRKAKLSVALATPLRQVFLQLGDTSWTSASAHMDRETLGLKCMWGSRCFCTRGDSFFLGEKLSIPCELKGFTWVLLVWLVQDHVGLGFGWLWVWYILGGYVATLHVLCHATISQLLATHTHTHTTVLFGSK